jgi:hypothetical protein
VASRRGGGSLCSVSVSRPTKVDQRIAIAQALRHNRGVTQWEYARLEYAATGTFGGDRDMDWTAVFHFPGGRQRWGTDESFDDLRHLNRAGEAGWQAYDRQAMVIGQPQRLHSLTYSMKRPVT